jgi:hypothetical protein
MTTPDAIARYVEAAAHLTGAHARDVEKIAVEVS